MTKDEIRNVVDMLDARARDAAAGRLTKVDLEYANRAAISIKAHLSSYGLEKLNEALRNLKATRSPKYCAQHGGLERVAQFVHEDLHRVRYELD